MFLLLSHVQTRLHKMTLFVVLSIPTYINNYVTCVFSSEAGNFGIVCIERFYISININTIQTKCAINVVYKLFSFAIHID